MFKLPPVKSEAILILGALAILFIILAIGTSAPGGPKPNTVASAIFLTAALLEGSVVCWGSLFSTAICNWIFEPSKELADAALGLFVGGGLRLWGSVICCTAFGSFYRKV
jgi:hypothetical protein